MRDQRRNGSVWARLVVVTLFTVAMAYLESAVVVYLREIFHLSGDLGTITPSPGNVWLSLPYFTLLKPDAVMNVLPRAGLAYVEIGREAATVVMLASLAWLAGRTLKTRAAYFLYAFGLWDIGYYIFLRLLIGWPRSLGAQDVLFLIPGPWLAPVFLPVAISALMIAAAIVMLETGESQTPVRPGR